VQENNDLRSENEALRDENARSRVFIERILRHQAFQPFLEDLSHDESLQAKPIMSNMSSGSTTPTPAPVLKEPSLYQSQQFNAMSSQPETHHVGMTLIPETPIDMSMLNITSNSWNMNNHSSFNYQQPQVFAVLELPEGPVNPMDTVELSGKGYSSIFSVEDDSPIEQLKPDFPVVERPIESSTAPVVADEEEEEQDPEFDLYYSSPASSSPTTFSAPPENHESLFGDANPEKVFAHFDLFISEEAADVRLMARFERQCAKMNTAFERIAALTSHLDL
jgi:hypothetical protein